MREKGRGNNRDISVTASFELLALLMNDNVILKSSLQSSFKVISELFFPGIMVGYFFVVVFLGCYTTW